eukprot:m.363913 g.363913  ORF g.363913 m.363913 type:complete len:72 (-) comp20806_c0_seq8:172-387(-)
MSLAVSPCVPVFLSNVCRWLWLAATTVTLLDCVWHLCRSFIFNVLLPEAVIRIHAQLQALPYEKAEAKLLA